MKQTKLCQEMPEVKKKIICSARELFVKNGYHNTNMPEITKHAEISTGAIYHYFKGKEVLAKEIHDISVEILKNNFESKIKIYRSTRDKINSFVELMFEWTENDPIMVEYLLYARPQEIFSCKTSICSDEGFALVMDIIKSGQKNKEIKSGDPSAYYAVLSGTVSRYIELYLDQKLKKPITSFAKTTAEIIWTAIKEK